MEEYTAALCSGAVMQQGVAGSSERQKQPLALGVTMLVWTVMLAPSAAHGMLDKGLYGHRILIGHTRLKTVS